MPCPGHGYWRRGPSALSGTWRHPCRPARGGPTAAVTPTEIGHRRDIRDHSGSRGLHRDPAWNRHRRQHRFGRGRSPALWQATARAEELLDALATDRPPIQQLNALLGYLREVVLARIAEEDRQAFPLLRRAAPASIARLRQDHLLLCDDVDNLAVPAVAGGFREPDTGRRHPTRVWMRRRTSAESTECATDARLPKGPTGVQPQSDRSEEGRRDCEPHAEQPGRNAGHREPDIRWSAPGWVGGSRGRVDRRQGSGSVGRSPVSVRTSAGSAA